MHRRKFRILSVAAVLLAFVGGCSDSEQPPTAATPDEVTLDDVRDAFGRAVGCIEDAGVEIVRAEVIETVSSGLVVEVEFGEVADGEAVLAVQDRCYDQYLNEAYNTYAEQNVPTRAEEDANRDIVAACAIDAGVEVDAGLEMQELIEDLFEKDPDILGVCMASLDETP